MEGHHRQNRSEYFFLHHGIFKCHLIHDRRCNLKECAITLAACDNLRRIDQSNQTSEMLLIDNAAVIGIRQRIVSKLLPVNWYTDLITESLGSKWRPIRGNEDCMRINRLRRRCRPLQMEWAVM